MVNAKELKAVLKKKIRYISTHTGIIKSYLT